MNRRPWCAILLHVYMLNQFWEKPFPFNIWSGELALSCNPSYLGGSNCGMAGGGEAATTSHAEELLCPHSDSPDRGISTEDVQVL